MWKRYFTAKRVLNTGKTIYDIGNATGVGQDEPRRNASNPATWGRGKKYQTSPEAAAAYEAAEAAEAAGIPPKVLPEGGGYPNRPPSFKKDK